MGEILGQRPSVFRKFRALHAGLRCQTGRLAFTPGDHRLGGMFVLSLSLGLRIGEISGLAWKDIDLDARVLKVRQQVRALGMGVHWFHPLGYHSFQPVSSRDWL
jgi:integrase